MVNKKPSQNKPEAVGCASVVLATEEDIDKRVKV
jgi:hypothetical protein